MQERDSFIAANEALWEQQVEQGCGYTIPWLDLERETLLAYAQNKLQPIPPRFDVLYPEEIFRDIVGKKVLCLAAGGGQQSAAFGLLGAEVTVFDLAQGQLDGDQKAAAHYGYDIITVKGDMQDLSALPSTYYDVVYQANSAAYIADLQRVFLQVAKVLGVGGVYRVVFGEPATFDVEWDGKGYSIMMPYRERLKLRQDGGKEFRHYLSDIFNGLLAAGLAIEQVVESRRSGRSDLEPEPGTWTHQKMYVPGEFAVVTRKGWLIVDSLLYWS